MTVDEKVGKVIHREGEFSFHDLFCNGKKEGEGKETIGIHITTYDMPEEKALKVRKKMTKFVEDELSKELGW